MKKIINLSVLTLIIVSMFANNAFALYTEYRDDQGTRGRATAYYNLNTGPTVTLKSVTSYLSSMSSVQKWSYYFKFYNSSYSYSYSGGPFYSNYRNRTVDKTLSYPYIDHHWYYTIGGKNYHRTNYWVVVHSY